MQEAGRPACRKCNSVTLNGGLAECKFASNDHRLNVFQQGKRRLMLATWLTDDAANEDTGRPACNERAVRHADDSDLREPSDCLQSQNPTGHRRTSSTVNERTIRRIGRMHDSQQRPSRRRAVRHARDGPSGMRTKAIGGSCRTSDKLNNQTDRFATDELTVDEQTDGLVAHPTASSAGFGIQAAGRPACSIWAVRCRTSSGKRRTHLRPPRRHERAGRPNTTIPSS